MDADAMNTTSPMPITNSTSGPPMVDGPTNSPDYIFGLGYQAFIIVGIATLSLFSLPRTFHFLRSKRRNEGWWLYHSTSSLDPATIQITRYESQLSDYGVKVKPPQVVTVAFPGAREDADLSLGLPGAGSDLEESHTKERISRVAAQPIHQRNQGIVGAYMDWIYAKMTKFIGGPISMQVGPWIIVLVINMVANALFALGPPFFVAPNRPARIAIAQIPILFILGTKNNVLTCILGRSYEKLNFVHRTVGRLTTICATLHVVGQFVKYSRRGVLGQVMRAPWVQAGLAAWIGLIIITLSSIGPVRTRFYNWFLNCHYIGIPLFMIAIHFHMPAVVAPYTLVGLSLYFVDLVLRAFKMRLRPATITAIDGGMTLIAIQGIDNGWRAGQHVWLRILQGDRSWESHPFTISNAPVLHTPETVKAKGLPSRGLLIYARASGDFTRALNEDARLKRGIEASVIVDGPYGGIGAGLADVADNRSVLLIAGGGGVSFTIAVLEELVSRSAEEQACTEVVDFIWVVKDYAHLNWHMTTIEQIILAADTSPISLRIHLFVTKTQNAPKQLLAFPASVNSNSSSSLATSGFSGTLEISFKRPDIPALVGEAVNYAALAGQSSAGGGGLMIVACGPAPVVSDVQLATRRISVRDRRFAGGISLHTENFCL